MPPVRGRSSGADEREFDAKTGQVLVEIDPNYFRPTEVDILLGDPTRAREKLGWTHKTSFPELIAEMVASDLELIRCRSQKNT